MRRSLNLLVLVLLIPVLLVLGVTVSADTLSLIPRRVFFSQTSSVESIDEERRALTGALVDYLYTTIAALQPIVRVEESERAHSSVLVDLTRAPQPKSRCLIFRSIWAREAGEDPGGASR